MDSILYNYSDIDTIMINLVEDIEIYFQSEDYDGGYFLNKCMDFEIDQIQINIYIHQHQKEKHKKYYYDLSAKNFKYPFSNDENYDDEIDLFKSKNFDTVLELFENLKNVIMNYTFFDNILCSPKDQKKLRKLKKSLSFFSIEEKECSICYEPTKQVTQCNHPICLHCRETCIRLQKENCPICRGTKLTIYPYPDRYFVL